jgi:hypothetical protein
MHQYFLVVPFSQKLQNISFKVAAIIEIKIKEYEIQHFHYFFWNATTTSVI